MNCLYSACGESPIQRAFIVPDNDVVGAAELVTGTSNSRHFPLIKNVYCIRDMLTTVYKIRIVVKGISGRAAFVPALDNPAATRPVSVPFMTFGKIGKPAEE